MHHNIPNQTKPNNITPHHTDPGHTQPCQTILSLTKPYQSTAKHNLPHKLRTQLLICWQVTEERGSCGARLNLEQQCVKHLVFMRHHVIQHHASHYNILNTLLISKEVMFCPNSQTTFKSHRKCRRRKVGCVVYDSSPDHKPCPPRWL